MEDLLRVLKNFCVCFSLVDLASSNKKQFRNAIILSSMSCLSSQADKGDFKRVDFHEI